jgi:hypothetical protein
VNKSRRKTPEGHDPGRWAGMSEEARHRKRQRARARHRNRQVTGDGVTDEQILERDKWTCRIDQCLYRSRRINPKYKYPDKRSASIDHILPLSLGGDDTQYNKRACHFGCNMARGTGRPGEQMPLAFGLDQMAALTPRKKARKPRPCKTCGEPLADGRCQFHMRVHYYTCRFCGKTRTAARPGRKVCDRWVCQYRSQATARVKRRTA